MPPVRTRHKAPELAQLAGRSVQALLVAHSCACVRLAGFAPAAVPLQQSKLARSKLIMCDADAAVAEPEPAEEKESVLDSLSDTNAELLNPKAAKAERQLN